MALVIWPAERALSHSTAQKVPEVLFFRQGKTDCLWFIKKPLHVRETVNPRIAATLTKGVMGGLH